MKRNLLISTLIALLTIGLYSCKKDTSNSAASAVKLLTSSRWTFQKYEYNKNGTWIPDDIDPADPNKFTVGFNANNTFSDYSLIDGSTVTGTWNFSSNSTVLTTTGGDLDMIPAVYTVTQLTSSTLQLTNLNYPYYSGQRITFKH